MAHLAVVVCLAAFCGALHLASFRRFCHLLCPCEASEFVKPASEGGAHLVLAVREGLGSKTRS